MKKQPFKDESRLKILITTDSNTIYQIIDKILIKRIN